MSTTDRLILGRISAKSVCSTAFGLVILVCLIAAATRLDWTATMAALEDANGWSVLAALTVFYLGFLARTRRWQVLLDNAGWNRTQHPAMPGFSGLAAIMYRGWMVNTVTIARAGDAYRAFRLRLTAGVSLASATGTMLTERLVDLAVLAAMLVPAVVLSFHRSLPAVARWTLGLAAIVAIAGPAMLISARRAGAFAARIAPPRFRETIDLLTDGVTNSLARYPLLLGLSVAGWAAECAMVLLAARAIGVRLPVEQAAMLALLTAMLSTIPITPGGLGVADAGLVLLLGQIGIERGEATAIAVIVRAIALGSVVAGGGMVWLAGAVWERTGSHARRARQWA